MTVWQDTKFIANTFLIKSWIWQRLSKEILWKITFRNCNSIRFNNNLIENVWKSFTKKKQPESSKTGTISIEKVLTKPKNTDWPTNYSCEPFSKGYFKPPKKTKKSEQPKVIWKERNYLSMSTTASSGVLLSSTSGWNPAEKTS